MELCPEQPVSSVGRRTEKDKLDSQAIATDGIAVIVNKNNTTDELSSDQVKDIYTGNAVAWDEVVK